MRDLLRYVRLTARIMAREDLWFVLVPISILFIACAWTIAVVSPGDWDPANAVSQAEVLGSLLAAFLCAGLLDPEHRRGAAEIVFSKPHPPSLLLGVRLFLMMLATLFLVLCMLVVYQLHFGDAAIGTALFYALPPCLFVGMIAVTAGQAAKTAVGGVAVSLCFWLWDSTAGGIYNPLLILPGGAMNASTPADQIVPYSLAANKVALLIGALLLFRLNALRLRREGGRANPSSGRGFLRRLRSAAVFSAWLLVYAWTGLLYQIWLHEAAEPRIVQQPFQNNQRPWSGQTLIGLNQDYGRMLSAYGPLPVSALIGPGGKSFLRGLGYGLDQTERDYDALRLQALEQAIKPGTAPIWRNHARLELAAGLVVPGMVSFTNLGINYAQGDEQWITVGLADSDRWWVSRMDTGNDQERADRLCVDVLSDSPTPAVAAEALRIRAFVATERWDFRAAVAFQRQIVDECSETSTASYTVSEVAQDLFAAGRTAEASAVTRRVMSRQTVTERVRLAPQLAGLLAANGEREQARATLEKAKAEGDAYQASRHKSGRDPMDDWLSMADVALKNLERSGAAPPAGLPRQTPAGGMGASVPRFTAHTRLLANGRPFPNVTVGLVPLASAGYGLPVSVHTNWIQARGNGEFPAPPVRSIGGNGVQEAWDPGGLAVILQNDPALIARSDKEGNVKWASIPAGSYAVVLRITGKQLRDQGRTLSIVPPTGPATVDKPDTALPDVRLIPALPLEPSYRTGGPPSVKWSPVAGAMRYRVALRFDDSSQINPMNIVPAGGAAASLDPSLVWWKDGVTATIAELTPQGFVGPAEDARRNGLHGGMKYIWSVEAFDKAGMTVAVSEPLGTPETFNSFEWTALRPPKKAEQAKKNTAKPVQAVPAQFIPNGIPDKFSSPFLEYLLQDDKSPQMNPLIQNIKQMPGIVFKGQGLPPRRPLAGAAPAGIPAGMPSGIPNGAPIATPPMPAAGPLAAGIPPGTQPLIRPATGGPMPPMAVQPSAAFPQNPPAASAQTLPPMHIPLEMFEAGCLSRWESSGVPASEPAEGDKPGLLIRGPVTLTPRAALPLPDGTRTLQAALAGKGKLIAVLKDKSGKDLLVPMKPSGTTGGLSAALPKGAWTLAALKLMPEEGAEIKLSALLVQVSGGSGVYAIPKGTRLEIYNLGAEPEHVTVGGEANGTGKPYAVLDIAPRGSAMLPLPDHSPDAPVFVRWSKGMAVLGKQ